MSQSKKKKVVITTSDKKIKPTVSKIAKTNTKSNSNTTSGELAMNKSNYFWMIFGLLLMTIGFLLMLGGNMPSPDVWDESLIYSFRRITLAPIFILAGLGVEVYAIFKS